MMTYASAYLSDSRKHHKKRLFMYVLCTKLHVRTRHFMQNWPLSSGSGTFDRLATFKSVELLRVSKENNGILAITEKSGSKNTYFIYNYQLDWQMIIKDVIVSPKFETPSIMWITCNFFTKRREWYDFSGSVGKSNFVQFN